MRAHIREGGLSYTGLYTGGGLFENVTPGTSNGRA